MYRTLCIGLLLALFTTGCASDIAIRSYTDRTYPPVSYREVEVLFEAPDVDFFPIGDIQARHASKRFMQKHAARMGADAVILVGLGGYRHKWDIHASKDRYHNNHTRLKGTAIRYVDRTGGTHGA